MSTEEDSKKRLYEQDTNFADVLSSKRAALDSSKSAYKSTDITGSEFHFKILCPSSIAGTLIGKGGSVINGINQTCAGGKMKLSQNTEVWPGTTDRIILASGTKDGILKVIDSCVTKIGEAPERRTTNLQVDMMGNPIPAPNRTVTGSYLIRVLVNKMASGHLIGKGGSVIKHMAEISGCRLTLGDDSDIYNTGERTVVLNSHDVKSLVLGVQAVMSQLINEQKVRSYPSLGFTYAQAGSLPIAPMMPVKMPMMSAPHYNNSMPPMAPGGPGAGMNAMPLAPPNGSLPYGMQQPQGPPTGQPLPQYQGQQPQQFQGQLPPNGGRSAADSGDSRDRPPQQGYNQAPFAQQGLPYGAMPGPYGMPPSNQPPPQQFGGPPPQQMYMQQQYAQMQQAMQQPPQNMASMGKGPPQQQQQQQPPMYNNQMGGSPPGQDMYNPAYGQPHPGSYK